ncbi:MAG: alpha/beta hydrolase [Marinagarivorans sp.]|nr:alpha/beta hydrolase [Marinagarivorans sp.]
MHIILLRGLGRESAHWGDFPEQLKRYLDEQLKTHTECDKQGITIYSIDLPSCGEFHQQAACKTIAEMTEHARDTFNRKKNASPKTLLIGLSMGGMVALDWSQRYPQEITYVVLINSSLGTQPLHWRIKLHAWPIAFAALLAPLKWREYWMLKLVSNDKKNQREQLKNWLYIQQQRPVSRCHLMQLLIAAARFKPLKTSLKNGLIITSQQDQLVSSRCSHAIAAQYQWPLLQHPSAGHDLPMDAPEWLCKHLSTWLKIHLAKNTKQKQR